MPATKDTYVNPLLTNISVAYKNTGFIAEEIFPTVEVDKETGIYFVEDDKEKLRAPADTRRAELGRANRVTNTLTQATYALEERSLETPISDKVMRNYSDPFDPKKNATELVTEKLYLQNEKEVANLLATSTGVDENGAWSVLSTNLVAKAQTAHNAILKGVGYEANTVVIGKPALDIILANEEIADRIKYTGRPTPKVILEALAEFFSVERVLIGRAVENTAKEGQNAAVDFLWGDNVSFLYVPSSPALETPAAGYRITQRDQRYVDEWYEQEVKAHFVRANDTFENKIVAASAIYTFSDVVA